LDVEASERPYKKVDFIRILAKKNTVTVNDNNKVLFKLNSEVYGTRCSAIAETALQGAL